MAGIDENVAVVGEWATPNPSPRTMFSSMMGEDFGSKSFSELLTENEIPEQEKQKGLGSDDDEDEEDEGGGGFSGGSLSASGIFGDDNSFSRANGGGLAARMAARAGFSAPRLNTARIRSANLSSNSASLPEVRSPYLMIPPGLSPTTLLDSPVFLSNSQAQLSPTTGTFPLTLYSQQSSREAPDTNIDLYSRDIDDSSFAFKIHVESSTTRCLPSVVNEVPSATDHQKSLASTDAAVQLELPLQARNLEGSYNHSQTQTGAQHQQLYHLLSALPELSTRKESTGVANNMIDSAESNPSQTNPSITPDHSSPPKDQLDGEGDQKVEFPPAIGAPAEDGYNWRKYGQKQVKGSEYPRSYYKCTHLTCLVKKKVERSHDGHITEIIYKGAHNHPKPPPNRRSGIGSTPFENSENHGGSMNVDGESIGEGKQHGTAVGVIEWRKNGMEITSSSAITEFCHASTSMQVQNGIHPESADALEASSALSNDDDEDDRGTHGSTSMGDDGDGDESESKRRKKETSLMDISAASRAIREPRVVVQTTSEVDILDDGYRWRKYGQKVVKGNPNPSLEKCLRSKKWFCLKKRPRLKKRLRLEKRPCPEKQPCPKKCLRPDKRPRPKKCLRPEKQSHLKKRFCPKKRSCPKKQPHLKKRLRLEK